MRWVRLSACQLVCSGTLAQVYAQLDFPGERLMVANGANNARDITGCFHLEDDRRYDFLLEGQNVELRR